MSEENPASEPEECHQNLCGFHIRRKRMLMGITANDLADFFGIAVSTLTVWEKSPVIQCRPDYRCLPENFLSGLYDSRLQSFSTNKHRPHFTAAETRILQNMQNRIRCTHALCSKRPDLQQKLLRTLQNLNLTG